MIQYGRWLGAVLPGNPPIDKIIALCLLIIEVTGLKQWADGFKIEFWRKNDDPDPEQQSDWEKRRLYPIDIGSDKYHRRKLGSATEVVATDLGLDFNDRLVKWVVKIANRNNRTGYLKGLAQGQNVAWCVRELFKPTMFVKPEVAVEAAAHVVFTELKFRQMRHHQFVRRSEEMERYPELVALRKRLVYSTEPFTLSRYLAGMFCLGDDPDEIKRRVEFWLNNIGRARRLNKEARKRVEAIPKREFDVDGRLCVYIKTDDDRLARALFTGKNPPAAVLAQRRNGCFQILTNKRFHTDGEFQQSVRELFKRLSTEEPQNGEKPKWFFDDRLLAVLNGSRSLKHSAPSGHSVEGVIRRMQSTLKFPKGESRGKRSQGYAHRTN